MTCSPSASRYVSTKAIREQPHGQTRARDVVPYALPAANADDGGRQHVRAAAQGSELPACCVQALRFAEPLAVADQDLVRPDRQRVRRLSGDASRLQLGQ